MACIQSLLLISLSSPVPNDVPLPNGEIAVNRSGAHHNSGIILDGELPICFGPSSNVSSTAAFRLSAPLQAEHSVLRTSIDPVGRECAFKCVGAFRQSGDLANEISER